MLWNQVLNAAQAEILQNKFTVFHVVRNWKEDTKTQHEIDQIYSCTQAESMLHKPRIAKIPSQQEVGFHYGWMGCLASKISFPNLPKS